MNVEIISTEVLILSSNHKDIGRTKDLTVLDYYNTGCITSFLFVYENCTNNQHIDVSKMKNALQNTLDFEFPELTGSLEKKERIKLHFDNTGVLFVCCKGNFVYNDLAKMSEDKYKSLLASNNSLDSNGDKNHLCQIKVTILEDKSFTVAVSINHGIQDAHGNFWFVNAWSERFSSMYTDETDRVKLYTNSKLDERVLINGSGTTSPVENCRVYSIIENDSHWFQPSVNNVFTFQIAKKKSNFWKNEYLNLRTTNEPAFLSSNDILCAIFWKAVTKAKQLSKTEETNFFEVVNARSRLGLSNNFTGNCIVPVRVKTTVDNLMKMSITETACLIRKEIIALDKSAVKSILNFMEGAKQWKYIKSTFNPQNDFIYLAWDSFPLLEPSFGYGKPKRFYRPIAVSSVLASYPHQLNNLVELKLKLRDDQLKCVLNDDLVKQLILKE